MGGWGEVGEKELRRGEGEVRGGGEEEEVPWEESEEEDEEWMYSSVSRYDQLLMCRL